MAGLPNVYLIAEYYTAVFYFDKKEEAIESTASYEFPTTIG